MLLPTKWSKNHSVHLDPKSPSVVMRTDITSSRLLCFADNPIPIADMLSISRSCSEVKSSILPFEVTGCIYYFEVEILSNVNDGGSSEISIGIAPVDADQQHDELHISTYNSFMSTIGSVSYASTGLITRSGKSKTAVRYGTHDVIGCGCEIGGGWKIFFTCNGNVITESHSELRGSFEFAEKAYFPAVEILGIGTTIRVNFGSERFQLEGISDLIRNVTSGHLWAARTQPHSPTRVEQRWPAMPVLGHSQTHSFMSRISTQLSQPLFRHSQSDPNHSNSGEYKEPSHDFQSDDDMVAIASALSLEPSQTVTSYLDSWTNADTSQAQGALLLLRELVAQAELEQRAPSSCDTQRGFEAMSVLCETLVELQRRMRRCIDISPENETLLELNDKITDLLLEVAELKEVVAGRGHEMAVSASDSSFVINDDFNDCINSVPAQPSLVSIMYMLRRGTKDEVLTSVDQLLLLCDIKQTELFSPNRSLVATKAINDIRVAGGLQTLVSSLHRCLNWPEVELQISIAVAILVSFETDWHVLLRESQAVLSSLQILLLRKNEFNCSEETETCLGRSEDCQKNLYCLVSSAVRRFCALLCAECRKPSTKTSMMFSVSSDVEKCPELALDGIHGSLSATPKHSAALSPATDDAFLCRTLETLVHIIQTLCEDSIIDSVEQNLLRSSNQKPIETSLTSVDDGRARATSEIGIGPFYKSENCNHNVNVLGRSFSTPDLLHCAYGVEELEGCIEPVNSIKSKCRGVDSTSSDATCLIDDVVILCSHALSDLCHIEYFRASLVAGDVLSLLVKWLRDSTLVLTIMLKREDVDDATDWGFTATHSVIELVDNIATSLASITAADATAATPSHSAFVRPGPRRRSFNQKHSSNYTIGWIDAQVMAAELPMALVMLIDLMTAKSSQDYFLDRELPYCLEELGMATVVTSLSSLASRSQNRSSLLSCGTPAAAIHLLKAVVSQIKHSQQSSSALLSNWKDSQESDTCSNTVLLVELQHKSLFYQNLTGQCLHLLSYFLADNVADIPTSVSSGGALEKPPAIVDMLTQRSAFGALVHAFSFNPCLARLQAVKVLSMIVEWPQVMELLYQEGISTALAVMLEDANERYEYEMVGESEGGGSSQTGPSRGGAVAHPASPYVLEETMRACYSLANLCHAKLSYALQCFESGLMTIVLRTVRHVHGEVQRQALRCISGMCPVLSVLTPGAHPSLMIASLKAESTLLNPARSHSSGSATETRAMAKKLHGNVIDFVNALRALTHALSSPSMLIKMEALRGISHLAKDDHLRVGIVEGPLNLIIALLLDPQCEIELQQVAESVLVNIGFVGGREDLDVVGKDPQLLAEWFYIRRSLRLQKSCHDILQQWINGLFHGCDYAEKKAKQLYIAELGREATLAENVDEDSLFLHFPEGIDIDIRDTVDLVGLSVVTNVIEKIVGKRKHQHGFTTSDLDASHVLMAHKQSANLREALLLQFTHLFDAWKLLRHPHVSPSALNLPCDIFPSVSNDWIKDRSENYFNFSPGGAKKRTGLITERFFAFMTFCTGKGAQRVVEEEEAEQLASLVDDKRFTQSGERDDSSLNLSNYDYRLDDLDDGLNFPPAKVLECLDLFFPSKLHQALVCDLFSIGKVLDHVVTTAKAQTRTQSQTDTPPKVNFSTPPRSHGAVLPIDTKSFKIPEPKQFRSLVLPSRTYFSFAREGRVLKKVLDDVANVEKTDMSVEASSIGGYADVSKTLWSLSFRNSIFHGEFMMTLVNTLRSLPQISSLSFVCRSPQEDSELGYFGGNVPASVRFLSFQNALSSGSIDALCTYLRAQNLSFRRSFFESPEELEPGTTTTQGLLGLSITSSTLTMEDVKILCELLKGSDRKEVSEDPPHTLDEVVATLSKGARLVACPSQRLHGLRYLDLSHNKLSDEQCSNVIYASIRSPLEGLELRGNDVHRGLYFCPGLQKYLADPGCLLRYLGVSSNGFINSTFRSILDCSQHACSSLTSLDVSCNGLTSSEKNCRRVREFLKANITMRVLNLSHNRFTFGMTRIFHLGLLENDTLIVLRLDGNISMNEREMYLVRGKLKANRDRYVQGSCSSSSVPAPNCTSSKTDRGIRNVSSKRRSDSSSLASQLSFQSLENAGGCDDGTIDATTCGSSDEGLRRAHHDRTLSDLGAAEKSDISNLFNTPRPVVAREILSDDIAADSDVPVSTAAYYPMDHDADSAKHHFISSSAQGGEDKCSSLDSVVATQTICVLFSAPLAWTDTKNHLHPIQTLDYPGERDTLIQAFREASRDIGVRFDFATTDTLRTALSLGVKVLHFSGHGHPHCLNFEDGRSGLQFVTMDALRALCTAGGNQLEFVFVSACHSRRAGEAFAGAGVRHVVCVTVEAQLLDAAAMAFTRAFYLALAVGHTVSHSFDIGKQAVFNSPYVPNSLAEGEKFLLLPEDGNHNMPVFRAKSVSQWPIPGSSLKGLTCDLVDNSHLPHTPEDFEGREVDMYSTIRILLSRRLVTIVGENGVGKSSVAVAVCSYLAERRKFESGVIFVRLRGVVTYEDFLLSMAHAIKSGSPDLASRFSIIQGSSGGKDKVAMPIRDQEDALLAFMSPLKSLVVLANITGLLIASGDTITEFKMFLSRLFDSCKHIKILASGGDVIGMTGFGMVEHVVSLGPLTLYSSLRLFARLSPALVTAAQKVQFVKTLLIPDQANVTLESRELSSAAAQILYMLGGGHPAKIVKIACESSSDRIEQMKARGSATLKSKT